MEDNSNVNINTVLIQIKKELKEINNTIKTMNTNIEELKNKIDKDVTTECKKMGAHIDFVEAVYERVRHPLGFICNRVTNLIGSYRDSYALESIDPNVIEPDELDD